MFIDKIGLSYRILLCTNTLRILNFLYPIKNTKNHIIYYHYHHHHNYCKLGGSAVEVSTQNCSVALFCVSVKFGLSLIRLASHLTGTDVLSRG
jgi:hypothetical protein